MAGSNGTRSRRWSAMSRLVPSRWRVLSLVGILVVVVGVVSCGTGSQGLRSPTANGPSLPALDAALVTRGREVYLQNCAACHGANAQGAANWQRPDARGDLPPPPHDDSGHTWRHGDAELTGIIRTGMRDVFNKTSELTMPPFKDRLSDADIAAVITYFKSLWSPEHRRYQEAQNRKQTRMSPEATP
jgi:mono/diheme cytochrome c family protein